MKSSDVILIFGQRRSGKTTLAKNILKNSDNLNLAIFDTLGEFKDFGVNYYELEKIDWKVKNIIYNPVYQGATKENFDLFAKRVWENGNRFLVVDELHNYATTFIITEYFMKIATQGAHRNVGLLGISQRLALLNCSVKTQGTHFFVFRLIGIDIREVVNWIPAEKEQVLNLNPFEYLYWLSGTKEVILYPPLKL